MIFEGSLFLGLSTFGLAAMVPEEPGRARPTLAAPQIVKTAAPIVDAMTAPAEGAGRASLPLGLAMMVLSGVLLISTAILGIYLVRIGRILQP
jgi:hypothetical protein